MPMIQEMIAQISGKKIDPHEVNPDEVVALGAAIQCLLLQMGLDPTPDPNLLVEKYIGGDGKPIKVEDGATHNLGLVILDQQEQQKVHVMIPKMTLVPCEVSDTFYTVHDNQPNVLIEVIQAQESGETPDLENNKLGDCLLELPPNLPSKSEIHVTYKYNLDQTLEVIAKGPDGRVAQATIQRKVMSDEEVEVATQHIQKLEVE